jgi:hypothetical protein
LKWKNINPELLTELRCGSGPPVFADKKFIELGDEDLICEADDGTGRDYTVLVGIIVLAMTAILVVVVAIVAITRYRDPQRWNTNIRYSKASTSDKF